VIRDLRGNPPVVAFVNTDFCKSWMLRPLDPVFLKRLVGELEEVIVS